MAANTPDRGPVRSPEAELEIHVVKFVGGTNAVTKVYGEGVTVTYVSAGIVDLVWSSTSAPGECLGAIGYCFEATTAADVKAYALATKTYDASTRTLRLNMCESGTLTNLAAVEWLTVSVAFNRTGF